MDARWLPVPGFPSYEVSDLGEVRSPRKTLKHIVNPANEYHYVGLYSNGGAKQKRVHRLVLEAFVGPCPPGQVGCHRNDDKDDNRLSNLEWNTHKANSRQAKQNGKNWRLSKTHCKQNHPWTERNTYIRPDTGTRQCKQCRLESYRKRTGAAPRKGGLYGGKGGNDYVG